MILTTALALALHNGGAVAERLSSTGSGFLISADGWVATNAHVVDGCSRVEIANLGRATDIQSDSQNDLAIVKLAAGATRPEPLKMRNSPVRLGEDVAALGYPLSTMLSDSIKITMGNINSLIGLHNDTRYLQISTPIQPGNSGGPLVDRNGFLLGINSAKLDDSRAIEQSGSIPQNVNFALKSTVLELFLQSRNIQYGKADPDSAGPLSSADLAEKVSKSVFQILCYSDKSAVASAEKEPPATSNYAPPAPTVTSHRDLQNSATELVRLILQSNDDPQIALQMADRIYADFVDFFGKPMSRREVLDDKRRYFQRWPIRSAQVNERTVEALCENGKCVVMGEYDWYVSSPQRNKRANGTAKFYYVLDMEQGKIVAEGGKARK